MEHIRARVCTRCGEAAFSRETAEHIRLLVPWCGPPRQDRPIGHVRACIGPLSTFRYCLFTEEELDFIINYDIKYHMGRDAEENE
ncbi:MAG: hypothetical protein ACREXS_10945 [Gammaproteobacteria bacterium]